MCWGTRELNVGLAIIAPIQSEVSWQKQGEKYSGRHSYDIITVSPWKHPKTYPSSNGINWPSTWPCPHPLSTGLLLIMEGNDMSTFSLFAFWGKKFRECQFYDSHLPISGGTASSNTPYSLPSLSECWWWDTASVNTWTSISVSKQNVIAWCSRNFKICLIFAIKIWKSL